MKTLSSRPLARLALVVACLALAAPAAAAQDDDPMNAWERFDFAKQTVRPEQLRTLAGDDLGLLRGIVFGRHGRVFKEANIQSYLKSRPWYRPDATFTNASLNEVERRNLDLIREAEARGHATIEPGDLRWWRDRAITEEALGEHTAAEWRVLAAEVEAIHGKRFEDQPWLQEYFEARYWYRPSDAYDPKSLTAVERQNLEEILDAARKGRHTAVSPGDMEFFETRPLTEEMLHGLSLFELRLLRNEVYARKGRRFRTAWLEQYFWSQPWYDPGEGRPDAALTETEKRNVDTIVAYENRLHEELATKRIDAAALEGLFLEDARKLRNEVFARHGMVFKSRWLQGYFESMPWYRPDPKFTEAALTAVERANVATILAYEKTATSEMAVIEG